MNGRRGRVEVLELLLLRMVHASHWRRAGVHVGRGSRVVGVGVVVHSHTLLGGMGGVWVCGGHPSRELLLLAVHGPGVVHSPSGAGWGVVLKVGVER